MKKGSPRRASIGGAVAMGAALLASPSGAEAQGFQLDQFRAAETSRDGFAISSPSGLGHLDAGARLSLDYGLHPLVYEEAIGMAESERFAVVEHQLSLQLGVALGLFDRVVIYGGLPATLFSNGSEMAVVRADGTQIGDPHLGVRVRLFGDRDDPFALGLQFALTFPLGDATSSAQSYTGERGVTFVPRLMGEVRLLENRLRVGVNLGARIREATDLAMRLRVGSELTFGVGAVGEVVPDVLDLLLELYGATGFESLDGRGGFFGRESTPVELLGGARVRPMCEMEIGLAVGGGLSRGYGSTDVRAVLMVGYAHEPRCAASDDVVTAPDESSASIATPTPPPRDPSADRAASEPQPRDEREEPATVAPADVDHDGLLDANDACATEPEDLDGFEDADGCPDPDNDHDTLLDASDECPLAPGRPEDRGCPRAVRLDTETGQIHILQLVEFATNRDVILDRSFSVLEEVRAVIEANPQLRRLRVEGHTDDRGRDAANLELSRRRAASVMRWLVEHGVSTERFEAWGCGEVHPVETNTTAEGRQRNRRVEFHIVDPAPASGQRRLEGCVEARPASAR